MTELKNIRWKQRLENLRRAFSLLEEAILDPELNRLEMEGLVQRFEFTWELCWKTLKDYLEAQGTIVMFPRDTIKEAFRAGLIQEGDIWMEMMEKRNLMSHTYDELIFLQIISAIKVQYYPAIKTLIQRLSCESDD